MSDQGKYHKDNTYLQNVKLHELLFLQLLSPPELGDAEINFRLYPKGICVVMIRICKMIVPERTFTSSQGSLPKKMLASI